MTAVAEAPPLFGQQTPRVMSVPPWKVSLGDRCVDFAARAGLFLDPWQQLVLRESMGVGAGGKWTAPQAALLCPRQNGKGSILEALELFHLFALGTKLIVHSAHKFDTSQEHFLRMRVLIEGNPDLAKHVASMPTANGKEAIVLRNGNRLKFKARTVGGAGRGFSSDLLILDEAMLLPEKALDAMMPTLRARKNPQVWFTSSAGDVDSDALWRIVKRGREGAPRLAYFEWGCPSGVDVLDRANWAAANPGLGYRLTIEGLEDDLGLLSEDGFAREHLGIWDDTATGGAIDPTAWAALADPSAERGDRPVFGVATAPDRSWSAVAVAWRRPDGHAQVQLVDDGYKPTATWVQARVDQLRERWGADVLTDSASKGLIEESTSISADRAVADNGLADAVTAGTLRHGNQPALNTAIRAAQWKNQADTRVLDRRGSADISPLVAAGLALHGLGSDQVPNIW